MHVGFSFCLIFNIATRFLYNRTDFFLRTHAFTSPTDMASSSVRENVNLTITPTYDGVCGMLFYIILVLICIAKFEYMSIFLNILDQLLTC